MLYVLVNNNYQLRTLLRHFSQRREWLLQATLIAIPHTLTLEQAREAFGRVVVLETPMGRKPMPWLIGSYFASARKVKLELSPEVEDILLFFTEVEWLNQIVVQRFKEVGSRVVLLEDGGFGTYIPMGQVESDPLTLRERVAQAGYRTLPGLRQSRLFKVNNIVFPRLPDPAIDLILLYRDAPIHRDTPVLRVSQPAKRKCFIKQGSVIFLNEPLYDYYQTRESYLAGLGTLLDGLCQGFEAVGFKFHPRESQAWRSDISALISSKYPKIEIIDSTLNIEEIITAYFPEILASYFSTALLGIEYEDIEPMYLYHLLDDLAGQPIFAAATKILASWGYRFVESQSDIRCGFKGGLTDGTSDGIDLATLIGDSLARPGIVTPGADQRCFSRSHNTFN
jgi:hypothetical protein